MNYHIDTATKRRDKRGFLVDFLKGDDVGPESKRLGQVYLVTFEKKGAVRGNHVHETKNEWFCVIEGKINMILLDRSTHERIEMILDGDKDKYQRVFVGKGVSHAFKNITPTAMMLNYSDKPYYADKPDTREEIIL